MVAVVHIPLAKPMTFSDDAMPHTHPGGVGMFIANQGRALILIFMHHSFKIYTGVILCHVLIAGLKWLYGVQHSVRAKWCCGSKYSVPTTALGAFYL